MAWRTIESMWFDMLLASQLRGGIDSSRRDGVPRDRCGGEEQDGQGGCDYHSGLYYSELLFHS